MAVAWIGWLTLYGSLQTAHANPEYRIEPTPPWVIPVERGRAEDTLIKQASGGVYYLLSDSQLRVGDKERTRYHRLARQALTSEGLEHTANIAITFEPTYQTLVLHAIDVIRNGVVIPKLADSSVQVLQRETELERRIYDGSKTATIFLEDVRTGDIVDYAYSLRGFNPVFDGQDFGRLPLRFNAPTGHLHVRVVVPADSPIDVLPHDDAALDSRTDEAGSRSYRWSLNDVPAEPQEADQPAWYDASPSVQWSAYADWNAVARWARPLYAIPTSIGPELRAEIDRIAAAEPTPQGRVLAALRFVQGEIRYLGIAIGAASHAPTPPDVVLKRRFGDCKDKTLLFLTLLNGLGIDGRAALVSTELERGIENLQPNPGAFDHVIAQVRIGPATYWLDATRQPQLADLEHLTQADFGLALLIDPQTRTLAPMAQADAVVPTREIRLAYDARAGLDEPVTLTVSTDASGWRADSLRRTVTSSNIEELQKSYLNFYASSYPGITMTAPIEVQDDPIHNRIRVTEHYSIADLTEWSDDEQRYTATFWALDMFEALRAPAVAARVAPIGVTHPTDLTVITDVQLPEEWPIEADKVLIEDPAFVYERRVEPGDKRFSVTDRYLTRTDSVAAAEAGRYAGNLTRARDHTAYMLHWTDPKRSAGAGLVDRINWLILILGTLALGFWIWLAVRAWHVDHPPIGPALASAPSGLGSWLALPTIGAAVSPFLIAFGLYTSSTAWAPATWSALTTYGTTYHPLWAPVLLLELIGTLGLMVFWGLTCVLFFQRRTSAPIWYIRVMIASAVYAILDLGLMTLLPTITIESKDISDCVRQVLLSAIWTAYFLKSERVRATFVNRLRPATPGRTDTAPRTQAA